MFEFIHHFFTRHTQQTKTKLAEEEVLIIARDAADQPLRDSMCMIKVEERKGRLVWTVASATIGSGLEIAIDDATGKIINIKHVGVR